ncbi:MAG TPA: gephyrin-like molybdotransferase Glp [Edaphobacter sp.]|jgi:molybdopterin molybdotransferase
MRSASIREGREGERIVSFDEALEIVLAQARSMKPPAVEGVALVESTGRLLATSVEADRDQPPFDRSTRDGYAVQAEGAMSGATLTVAGQVQAGAQWTNAVIPGEAIEIMTGAPVPAGADAVIMLEHVEESGRTIQLMAGRRITLGENIVPRGSEARQGDAVLQAGMELDPAAVALAAACGAATVEVFRKPKVSILATGDELVDVMEVPGPQQIRNSNSYGLAALVSRAGAVPLRLPVAQDQREELERSIRTARAADLMLLTGGVSMGKYDLVEEVLLSLGATFFFTGVKMQPGKPVVFGKLPEKDGMPEIYFFGLPGNPVSSQVTFTCFAEPMLRAIRGGGIQGPQFVQATLTDEVAGKPGLTRMLPARLTPNRVRPEVKLVVWQGSGDMAANARANCYAVLPEEVDRFRPGDVITVLLR